MAPREVQKSSPKLDKVNGKKNVQKVRSLLSVGVKKALIKKTRDQTPVKPPKTPVVQRKRTTTVPKNVDTPKPKENKPPQPGGVIKSAKKSAVKRRLKPAHSGVPMPEKMQRVNDEMFNCSF